MPMKGAGRAGGPCGFAAVRAMIRLALNIMPSSEELGQGLLSLSLGGGVTKWAAGRAS